MDRIMLRLSTGEHVDGLWVGTDADKPEPVLYRLREALRVIKTYDPLRYFRLIRDLDRVWALDPAHDQIGSFDYRLRACKLNGRFVLAETTSPELLASVIVHEATHARLWGCGIGYDETSRPKVEAACIRRELAFAAKLPNGQQAREQAERILASVNHTNLANAALLKRKEDHEIEELRRLGVPSWLIRAMVALGHAIRTLRSLARRITRGAKVARSG